MVQRMLAENPGAARGRGRDAAGDGVVERFVRACLNPPRRCSPRRSASRASFAGTTRPPGPRTRATHGSRGTWRARRARPAASSWPELMHTVRRALAATDLITDLRVDYLPGSGGAAAAARGAGATRPAWADRAACDRRPDPHRGRQPRPGGPGRVGSRRSGAAPPWRLDAATSRPGSRTMRGSPRSASSCAGSSPSTAARTVTHCCSPPRPGARHPRRCSAWSRCWSRSRRGSRRRSGRGRGTASARASARPPGPRAAGCAACSTPRGRDRIRCGGHALRPHAGTPGPAAHGAGGEAVGWSRPGSSASPTRRIPPAPGGARGQGEPDRLPEEVDRLRALVRQRAGCRASSPASR